jgi:hypothetical protein
MNNSLSFIVRTGSAFNDRKEQARPMRAIAAEVHEMAECRRAAEAATAGD